MELLLVSLLGYIIGSIPFALVIGKGFYHTDVRQHGSGNLGASNTGRVLGKKAGIAVMLLDLLKATLSLWLAVKLSDHPLALACGGLSAALGHCYPLFANFRGGKSVATMYGFLLGLWIIAGQSPLTFFLPLAVFLAVLYLFKIVSLASMISALTAAGCIWMDEAQLPIVIATFAFTLLVIVRHRSNIKRILQGSESKISWM